MNACMEKIRLVLIVSEEVRQKLRIAAARLDVDMSDVAEVVLAHFGDLVEEGKVPPEIAKAIEDVKKAKGTEKSKPSKKKPK